MCAWGGVMDGSLFPYERAERDNEEEKLQRDVVKYLRLCMPHDGEFFHPPNGGLRHSKVQAKLIGMGLRAGVPDLVILYQGRTIFIELKSARGVLSLHQQQFHQKLRHCGFEVLVCRSWPCVETSLRELGVPLRGHVQA